jgi:hypothetical protein
MNRGIGPARGEVWGESGMMMSGWYLSALVVRTAFIPPTDHYRSIGTNRTVVSGLARCQLMIDLYFKFKYLNLKTSTFDRLR